MAKIPCCTVCLTSVNPPSCAACAWPVPPVPYYSPNINTTLMAYSHEFVAVVNGVPYSASFASVNPTPDFRLAAWSVKTDLLMAGLPCPYYMSVKLKGDFNFKMVLVPGLNNSYRGLTY